MYSLAFPKMFDGNNVKLYEDHEATASNLKLLILSTRTELFGDPYYGTSLKNAIYEQSDHIIIDLLIDDIYTSILTFMPQLYLTRNDISITSDKSDIFVNIKCINRLDYQTDLFNINLTNSGGENNG